jgi:hypothetical protein
MGLGAAQKVCSPFYIARLINRFLGLASIGRIVSEHLFMHSTTHALQQAVTLLLHAVPDPNWWSGTTATACATRIEEVVAQLHALEIRVLAASA